MSIGQIQASDCGGFPRVKGVELGLENSCLALVLSPTEINWEMPRQLHFISENELLISDMGGWRNPRSGRVLLFNIKTKDVQTLYSSGRFTHGLGEDNLGRLLIGDADKILRTHNNNTETMISDLPTKGSHPLTHFIVLPNSDLVVNIGAPSDRCREEMGSGTYCPSRDSEGELRLYSFNQSLDNYDREYRVLARGLRNSMALLYNPMTESIYQGENNMDPIGTPEELNEIPLLSQNVPDFGWPFCVGDNQQMPGLNGQFGKFCNNINQKPLFLIPDHAAPLDMNYYPEDSLFNELNSTLLMSWHGHRRSIEHAIVAYPVDNNNSPYSSEHKMLVDGINSLTGEKVRPVGIAIDHKGQIWFTDDQSKKLYLLSTSKENSNDNPTGPSFEEINNEFIENLDEQAHLEWTVVYNEFLSGQTCVQCHGEQDIPSSPRDGLLGFLNNNWLQIGKNSDEVLFVQRVSPEFQSPRSMPPPPANPWGQDHPETLEKFKQWVDQYL